VIADVLTRRSNMPVKLAGAGLVAQPGYAYVAPPNHHLLVGEGGTLTLSSSELVHFVRPSTDLLFESVAGAYGPAAIACVLTGSGSDGRHGRHRDRARSRIGRVQGMPEAAVATGAADFVLPLDEIGTVIRGLIETP
jgi:two-component system chemotaxis response regulator CheB